MANGEPSTAKSHFERVLHILLVALRIAPNVKPPIVIVLRQSLHQVLDEKHRVVVAKNEPPHVGLASIDDLLDRARHADRGPEPSPESVRKSGGVAGDDDLRAGAVAVGIERGPVEEGEGASGDRGAPDADVGLTAGPGGRGGRDGEDEVAARGGRGRVARDKGRRRVDEEQVEVEEDGDDQEECLEAR